MPIWNFNLNLNDETYQNALSRAQQEGKSIEALMAEYLTSYAGDVTGTPERRYTVKSGDTLTRIAREMYGDPYKYPLIQKANNINDAGHIWVGQVLVIPSLSGGTPPPISITTPPPVTTTPSPRTTTAAPRTTTPAPVTTTTPRPTVDPSKPIPGASFRAISVNPPKTDRPAHIHADLNLAMRGYEPTNAAKGLINIGGPTDSRAPQLRGLFADRRTPNFPGVYRVYDWNWGNGPQGARAGLDSRYEVSLIGMTTTPEEIIHVPDAGYSIGEGMQVLVLFATSERVTLKYTREDNVIDGYTIHIEDIYVEPKLQALYNQMNAAGRSQLPALQAKQPFARALGREIKVCVRDKGSFMDPRTAKDWWRS